MNVLSKLAVAASNLDHKVKALLFKLLDIDTVAAAGSDETDATALTAGKNMVTGADGAKGVILPVGSPGMAVEVLNTESAQDLKVYPETSGQINALTATTGAFTVVGGASRTFHCDAALHWYVGSGNLTGTATTASTAELNVLDSATAANDTTGKAAILGTDGAVTFGGAVTAVGSFIIGSADMSEADLELLDGITAGTSAPSKALTTDAAESLVWATTDATASETVTLSIQDTRTGAGATGWAMKGELVSAVALGSYANGLYGILTLSGASGKVTGLGAGVVAEIVMASGCADGTYAGLEVEVGMPSGALTGTATSLMYLSVYGDDAATFDDNGFVMNIAGLTTGASKAFANNCTVTNVNELTHGLKIKLGADTYYIPLVAAAAFQA